MASLVEDAGHLDAQRLPTPHHRLPWPEETVRKRKIKVTDEQTQALERFDPEYRERHIKGVPRMKLVAVGTFFAGTLAGRFRY